MTITINLSNQSFLENATKGTVIATLSTTGAQADAEISYSLADNDWFEIAYDSVNKVYQLVTKVEGSQYFDFETAELKEFSIKLTAEDTHNSELSEEISFTITVGDAPEETTKGTSKSEKLNGTSGADLLNGLGGNDKIYGLDGDDVLNGGTGKDVLYGGGGKDTFVFDTAVKKGQFDQVMDFDAINDTLQFKLSALTGYIKSAKSSHKASSGIDKAFKKGKLEKKFFAFGDHSKDSNDFIYYNKKNGFVYLDTDGSGKKQHGIEILKLKPGTAIGAEDFLFI